MIVVFRNDERAYVDWLRSNPDGYVFNLFGGSDPNLNVLHRASCSVLHRIADAGRRTVVPKLCCRSYLELVEDLTRDLGAEGWQQCAVCGG